MSDFAARIAAVVTGFSGVVSVSRGADVVFEQAYGFADRAHRIPCTPQTRFATASGTKGFTALAVLGLVVDGVLSLATTARSVLGADLPLISSDVTVEHLLNHTSGIGDYADEDDDPPLKVAVYELVRTEDYVRALDGFPPKFPANSRFRYCNAGYVVLALIAERAGGRSYHELVAERVWAPAEMKETGFLRSDALPGDAALGYLEDGRTNVFAVPVIGNGDGGAYTTVADVRRYWSALIAGRIVPEEWAVRAVSPQSAGPPDHRLGYGWGMWLDGPAVLLEGADRGVRFRSVFDRSSGVCVTVIANVETPINPIMSRLREHS